MTASNAVPTRPDGRAALSLPQASALDQVGAVAAVPAAVFGYEAREAQGAHEAHEGGPLRGGLSDPGGRLRS
ncbi:hypothetical protein VM98_12720 [Streptomyces rubellomurinus subsp. indigoferus]|nr:hypothetical protein VM98_12720 [Streptomyces rubellomurinus subsp. indigoferus]